MAAKVVITERSKSIRWLSVNRTECFLERFVSMLHLL